MKKEFIFPKNFRLNWYPGHMAKTYRLLPEKMKKVDVFLEIRDSRIPLSSANYEFNKLIPEHVTRLILFNKFDLCDQAKTRKIVEKHFEDNRQLYGKAKYMFSSAKTHVNMRKVIEHVVRENNPKFKTVGIWCLVGGIPNVGKSTMINAFRLVSQDLKELSKKSTGNAKTGKQATTTRHIDNFKVNLDPVVFIMDSPGVMPPKVYDNESGLRLSVCGNIKEKIVGRDIISNYLLFCLNKEPVTRDAYIKLFRLDKPVEQADQLLAHISKEFRIIDRNNASDFFIKSFRDGKLGKITFDDKISKELMV